ncbi:ThuA domain-containing protein [Streptomyces sp. RO-S4]|uniref:ThuA domain-containing protein n=1 Tax=unclassified Streptomyces TaxID=2593676 RepID=UPI00208FC9DE|nr:MULTISPECIES: ThuA domain-containing protein [unclassified Streptomyces]MCO4695366.1 ThuA domain-containing protein [Streptomyces sp. RO-S4]MDU0304553.1 ThuA domain-containing protein [Streptomyces sp. PAL114]
MSDPALLVYTRTTDYRHDSIPAGVAALRALGGFDVHAHEDPAALEEPLDRYATVVFLSTSGDVLTPAGRERLAAYVEAGGGFVGVHAAACTEYGWPYYGELLGARFDRHPPLQPGRAVVEDHDHPATRHLPAAWELTDEWYDFRTNPRPAVRVLLSADESSYEGGTMGADHPLAWCRDQGAGRVFYTSLGHTSEIYDDPDFRTHLRGGITWAATR